MYHAEGDYSAAPRAGPAIGLCCATDKTNVVYVSFWV